MAAITQGYKDKCFKQDSMNSLKGTQSTTKTTGVCCVCRKLPRHSRTYYGRLFCIHCFHKYIWNPTPNKNDSSKPSHQLQLPVNVKIN